MKTKNTLVSLFASFALCPSVFATFHLMQVEQLIGSLDGNTSAQAIQLRMRAFDQDEVRLSRLRAWDSTGKNPVLILDITSDVQAASTGARILLATPAFTSMVKAANSDFAPDFVMSAIPAGYLGAGRLTFEQDNGLVLWSLAWGGSNYSGTHFGAVFNDANGNFGPAFSGSVPTSGRRSILFQGPAHQLSRTNAVDYALSADPATVTRNSGKSFIIGLVPEIAVEQPFGSGLIDGESKKRFGTARVGGDGKTKTFTIRNTGTTDLTGLRVVMKGGKPGDFIVTGPAKTSLAAGTIASFKVTFKPAAKGTRNAEIRIRSNDADEDPFDIKVAGRGVLK